MQWMAEHNIASCAMDFRGHGRSAGKPGFVRQWDEHLTDLAAFLAIDALSTKTDPTPLFVLAHSHGALVTAVAAMRGMLNHCRGIILSSPFLDLKLPVPILKHLLGAIASAVHPSMRIKSGLSAPMLTRDPQMISESRDDPYCRGIATPRWFFSTRKVQQETRLMANQFNLPLLMLVAGDDVVANPQASVEFFNRCASTDKTIVHYPVHRHELMRELGREKIFQSILEWVITRANSNFVPQV